MELSAAALKDRMATTTCKTEYMRLQAVFLHKIEKRSAKDVAKIIGKSKEQVYQWAHRAKKFGIEGLINKPQGGRPKAYMTLEEEKDLLDLLLNDASKGLIIISKVVKQKAEEKLGFSVSDDYAQDLLNRHHWRKIAPRSKHPKSSKEEQEEFKKKSQNLSKKQQVHLTYKIVDL